jgi:hypothetical protein
MKWQEIPEGTVEEVIVPTEVHSFNEAAGSGAQSGMQAGRQVFDTGKIVSGWPRFKL